MRLAQYVQNAIDDYEAGKVESALLHACIAIDRTGKLLYPSLGVRPRFVRTINVYLWLIEPMIASGMSRLGLRDSPASWSACSKPR